MKPLLGGKGARTWRRCTNAGLPVPPGFTITTERLHGSRLRRIGRKLPRPRSRQEMERQRGRRREADGQDVWRLDGQPAACLGPVRRAKFSMPGMMDTILNLGLNDDAVEGPARQRTQNGRFAYDSYRRFIQMFGSVVPRDPEGGVRARVRGGQDRPRASSSDTDLDEDGAAATVVALQKSSSRSKTEQGLSAGSARSSCGARVTRCSARGRTRARSEYRRIYDIPDRIGHGRQRAGDGVRQHRRSLGHGRRRSRATRRRARRSSTASS